MPKFFFSPIVNMDISYINTRTTTAGRINTVVVEPTPFILSPPPNNVVFTQSLEEWVREGDWDDYEPVKMVYHPPLPTKQ